MIYDYTIHQDNSPKVFKDTCELISKAFPDAEKAKLLVDVDGSTIQMFTYNGNDIDVYDDYDVGAVFVKSQIPLEIFSEYPLIKRQ